MPGKYVVLEGLVEMYAWIEEKETKTKKKAGGTTEETITYRYKKDRTLYPKVTSEFKHPKSHENPPMSVKEEIFYASDAKIRNL